jgi:diguanylate cyclase (GGDEF)-like protein/putative nucleotidyltransferase with HDIG domain
VDHGGDHPRDPFALTFRLGTLKTGVWPSLLVSVNCLIYFALTADRPHRVVLAVLVGTTIVSSIVIAWLPMQRILRGRWCEPFFLAWSGSLVAIISVSASLDGGSGSPLVVLFFLPLTYAALSYPLPSMVIIGAVDLGAFLLVAALTDHPSGEHVFLFAAAIVNAAWICAWQSRNHDEHRRQLDRASRTDPLTGCLNRRGFEERFAAELSRARREGTGLALVLVDLDHFKAVNDKHGHAAGDRLLCWVAERLRADLRAEDMVARLGGDEFALLLVGTEASVAVERVGASLAERAPASVGAASFPADGVDQDDLHRVADADLYARKHGRSVPTTQARRELSWAAALAAAVDERMAVQHEHSEAVAQNAAAIARELGWETAAIDRLRLAAMLHDVGKVRVPEAILRKPAPLTAAEWEEIARHPVVGAEIVARVEGLDEIGPWIRHSHERIDGDGYPDGLRGDDIPAASRILLVADAYDAMTSDRSYRRALPPEAAMAELERHAGTQFDPACVDALRTVLARAAPGGVVLAG